MAVEPLAEPCLRSARMRLYAPVMNLRTVAPIFMDRTKLQGRARASILSTALASGPSRKSRKPFSSGQAAKPRPRS